MKKLFLLLAGVFLITACEKEPNVAPKVEEESQLSALDRYLTRVAEEGIGMLGDTPTRAGARRAIDPARTRAFVKATTRSEEDTLFYVVNFADSTGFALVEADTSSRTPLIAVTEQGNYTPGEVTNTGFDDYIELLSQNSTREHILLPIDTTVLGRMYSELEEGPETIVEPLLEVEWGQNEPYNEYCYTEDGYKAVTGCVPTAIAQILSYYEYPTTLTLTHPLRGDLTSITLDWDQIKYHQKNNMDVYGCWCADHTPMQHLFRQIGELSETEYLMINGKPVGQTDSSNVISTFQALGYFGAGYYSYLKETVWNELDVSRPVYCRGNDSNKGKGHAWVIDGYHYQLRIMKTYQEGVGGRVPTLIREDDWSYDWLHINWGWDGNCNGFYNAGVFAPTDGSYDFDYNIQILINIKPIE